MVLCLGNPGLQYRNTRHNVGFRVAEKIADENGGVFKKPFFKPYVACAISRGNEKLWLIKPLTFMNNSGAAAARALRSFRLSISNMLVVCDNLDLPPGTCRLKKSGSDAGHNGLKSIMGCTGSGDFMRLYIGIGHPGERGSVVDWVLGEPDDLDAEKIESSVISAASGAQMLLTQKVEQVMSELNGKH